LKDYQLVRTEREELLKELDEAKKINTEEFETKKTI